MTDKIVKGTIQFEDRKVIFEGPSDFVESMVAKYTSASKQQAKLERAIGTPSTPAATGMAERELVAAKQPHGHAEVVAVLAFALTESGTAVFTDDDIRRAYIRAGVRPPKVVAQALRDAKNRYEFLEATANRGEYRLSSHGDRVVRFDLPRKKE
jgi:hypothetical protein